MMTYMERQYSEKLSEKRNLGHSIGHMRLPLKCVYITHFVIQWLRVTLIFY